MTALVSYKCVDKQYSAEEISLRCEYKYWINNTLRKYTGKAATLMAGAKQKL